MAVSCLNFFLLLFLHFSKLTLCSIQKTEINFRLVEEQSSGTFVGNVAIVSSLLDNLTTAESQMMSYQILTQGNPHASLFTIDESDSTLTTASRLDREYICDFVTECVLEFDVVVYKQNPSSDLLDPFKIFKVKVTVEDINDNRPYFPEPEITLQVSENVDEGYTLVTSGALDHDTGVDNGVKSYRILPDNGLFALEKYPTSGSVSDSLGIKMMHSLDREIRNRYQFQIEAVDGGTPQKIGTLTVNIVVTDDNDNFPEFSPKTYNITVPENMEVGSTILQLSADDADADDNGLISYKFALTVPRRVMQVFAVNQSSGHLYVISEIDYETDKTFSFEVEAQDHGSPSKSSKATVRINVADKNDNVPQININLPPGGTDISESLEVGNFVATVAVSDNDFGVYGKVTCQIAGYHFALQEFYENVYKVVIKKKLDYEQATTHNVTILCQDGAIPPRENLTSFLVRVVDVNDNYPVFTNTTYFRSMDENNRIQDDIIQVHATDRDSGENGRITYRLHPDGGQQFAVHPSTGLITANKVFDRDTTPEILFRVLAADNGRPDALTATATVILKLRDQNDETPSFKDPKYVFFVLENQPIGTRVGNLTAHDRDAGLNGKVTYTLQDMSGSGLKFSLDAEGGIIKTTQKLDREIQNRYDFVVVATDKGVDPLSSSATVTVFVLDDNDNIPVITYPNNFNNTIHLSYDTPEGAYITQVKAHDSDENKNSELSYFIDQGDSKELFHMHLHTGQLTVAKKMHIYDAETYKLVIAVKDSGSRQLTSYANLDLVVTVSNDTDLSGLDGQEVAQKYVIIVVTIVVLTVVLSMAIIITICIIRRLDTQRGVLDPAKYDEQKIYEAKRQETLSASSGSQDTEISKLKSNKKEVSFSMDDESDSPNNSTLTNVTSSFSTFKAHPSYLSSIDGKLLEPQACSSTLGNSTTLGSSDYTKTDSFEKPCSEIPCLGSPPPRYQQVLLQQQQQQNGDKLWMQAGRENESKHLMDMLKKSDDAHSDASGESGTSDSGRGGSEEDIHSNRGRLISDTEDPRHYYPCDRQRDQGRQNNARYDPNYRESQRKRVPSSDIYPRNISFSDDSVTANTTVNSSTTRLKHSTGGLSPFNNFTPRTGMYSKGPFKGADNRELFTISGRTQRDTFNDMTPSTFGVGYSIGDIDDAMSVAGTRDDDDNTTTSGSYTINPDDLCNEIDELFFKDVIV